MNNNQFIINITEAHNRLLKKKYTIDERFLLMGKEVSIYPYLSAYHEDRDEFDILPENSFIGMNVSTGIINSGIIIPFFTYKSIGGGEKDEDRQLLLANLRAITDGAGEQGFCSFPMFLKDYKLERLALGIQKINHNYLITVDVVEGFEQKYSCSEIEQQLQLIVSKYSKTFIDSWYESIIRDERNKQEGVHVAVKVSDPDRDSVGKSFYVVIVPDSVEKRKTALYLSHSNCIPLLDVISIIKSLYIDDVYAAARNESRKSAKAAIMSRNMSHNLGSHVMAYLKQHLCSVTNILQDNILSDFISSSSFQELQAKIEEAKRVKDSTVKYVKEVSTEEGSLALPFLVGLGYFISYLQERQDFIATIATDYIPYYSTVNFKDFIYDEINPDKRYLRHKDRKNLQPDNILLGNIPRSEGLGRTISPTEAEIGKLSDIVIKLRRFDGNPVVNEGNIVLSGRQEAYDDLERMRKIDVSLPGGMVGRQAVFSIIENIVRNAAKHGNWRSEGRLELTFDFIDKEEIIEVGTLVHKKRELENQLNYVKTPEKFSEIQRELRDVIKSLKEDCDESHLSLKEVLWLFYSGALDKDDLFFVTITDNVKTSFEAVSKLRDALREDYIDDNGVMTDGNKGIKELRISAAWLRGGKEESEYYYPSPKEWITEPQTTKKAPLMYARQSNGHLQYIFCLLIPKRVAIVSKSFRKDVKLNKLAQKCLADSYWKEFTPTEYIEEDNKSYDFVLCDGEDCFKTIRPYSSSRLAKISSVEGVDRDRLFRCLQDGISEKECSRIELCLYRYFSSCDEGNDFICVDDKKAFARYQDFPSVVEYKWVTESEDPVTKEKKGYFIRSINNVQEKVHEINGLFDGMALVSEHDYRKIGQVLITDGGGFGKFVYRTHHDMNEEFNRFMGELRNNYKGCCFVESVTGNSSTDRLVRNDTFDEKWYYSHLRAMKQHIAIFDERLFAKIYGLEEVDFTRANAASGNLAEMKKAYINQFGVNFSGIINKCESIDDLNKVVSSNPALKKKLYRSEAEARNRTVAVDYQKGIYVYTFVKNPLNRNVYGMYGLLIEPEQTDILDAIKDVYHARTVKLLDLSWENNTLKITPYEGSSYLDKGFDYISIHQGLLDKLYEAFDIKDNSFAKVELTRQLYMFLKRGDQSIIRTKENGESQLFMPGMSVHSGRSKPNKSDMPQLVPFIQYAAIEHASLDCKYSLVELLDNARYE